jgi:predicted chitinase
LHDVARTRTGAPLDAPGINRRDALVHALLAKIPPGDRLAARTAIPAILDAAGKTGSTDPNQLGYLLATAQTESDFGANMVENNHPRAWFNKNYGGEDGNRPGTSDGYAFRGRGYVQTTHAGRYAELSHRLGLPDVPVLDGGKPILDAHGKAKMEPALIADPDRLAEPKLAAQALVYGVKHNLFTQNAAAAIDKTIPPGRRPGEVDFYHARALVNGIVQAQAQTIANHATDYAQVLAGYRHSVLGLPSTK